MYIVFMGLHEACAKGFYLSRLGFIEWALRNYASYVIWVTGANCEGTIDFLVNHFYYF